MSHNYGDLYERGYIDGLYSNPPMIGIQGEYSHGFLDGSEDRINYYSWRQYQPGDTINISISWETFNREFCEIGDILTRNENRDYIFDPLCLRKGAHFMYSRRTAISPWDTIEEEQRQVVCATLNEIDEREA